MTALKELGLLDSEISVYESLIRKGSASAGTIAKNTGLNRVSVYKALDKLAKRGLVNEVIKTKKMFFEPASPKILNKIVKEKKDKLEDINKEIKSLKKSYNRVLEETRATIHKGVESVKALWEELLDDLEEGEEWLILGAPKSADILAGYFKEFNKKRAKKKTRMKIIYNRDARELLKDRIKQPLTEVRTMPKEYITPVSLEVVRDCVLIVFYEPDIMAFCIKSGKAADSFKQYFKLLWKIAKPIK